MGRGNAPAGEAVWTTRLDEAVVDRESTRELAGMQGLAGEEEEEEEKES